MSLAKNVKDKACVVLKTKEFTFVNDCFQNEHNEVFGVFLQRLIKYFPFAAMIALNVFAEASGYRMRNVQPFVWIFTSLIALNLVLSLILKIKNYFLFGISGVAIAGALGVWLLPNSLGQFYIEHVIASMYFGLFAAAAFPPLFKFKPFTFEFSEHKYPPAIVRGEQFLKINLILNYIWAGLFAAAIALTVVRYHPDNAINSIIATLVPIALLLIIGIPVTAKLPNYLLQKVSGQQLHFKTIFDLFSSMPLGLNKEKAKGVNSVVQFHLTGKEPTTGYLTINNQQCTYRKGVHPKAKTTIHCDSELWLRISNNEVSGEKAFINKEYEVEGDVSIMLNFAKMFAPPQKPVKKKKKKAKTEAISYKQFAPNKIKNIVVFDGGYRSNKHSKTSFMVNNFVLGAKDAGAQVEYIKLKDYNISNCTGCYTCWTKTPGKCIFKDDMPALGAKYRDADLVVFASPLYIFNVTGIMKTFMDRLLPGLKPYMLVNDAGNIMHPDRYPEKGEQGFVVFSAAGFTDIEHNFDGLTGMYRAWDSHNENMHLIGEFYLPASEMLVQPVYAQRKQLVADLCTKAGRQIVEQGCVDNETMLAIQDPGVDAETFRMQADTFWESLDGKKSYMANAPSQQ